MARLDSRTLPDTAAKVQKRQRAQQSSKTTSAPKKSSEDAKSRNSASSARSRGVRLSDAMSPLTSRSPESSINRSLSSAAASSDFEEPDFILAEIEHEQPPGLPAAASEQTAIPQDLIHRLLHHHFQDKIKTKIDLGAREVVCKYIEIFVREALARSAFMRQEADGEGGGGDGFLEVEDLEKCAPLLVLDF